MIGLKTIRQGRRAAIWDRRGRMRLIDGPRRMLLFGQTVEMLELFSAAADEYLAVERRDGRCENLGGPVSLWYDPVKHKAISVKKAMEIDSHEAAVVYRRTGEQVERRVVRGPAVFVPTEKEWLHQFSWHGADPKRPDRKIPRALRFVKLRVIPDQMYFDVEEVRTADDALLVIRLMVFFELQNIETMLDQTHDPIADFINAVTADVIDFVGTRSFEKFKQNTEKLNDLDTFANLTARAERIGYKVNKVVYRGYHASDKLQVMHDDAIEARTALKLQAETEEQAQDLADLKLERQAERSLKQCRLEQQQAEHNILMEKMAHDEKLRMANAENESDVQARRRLNEIELENLRAGNAEQVGFLKAMQDMQVDLTRYLIAQYQNPDRLIKITGDDQTQLHLHEN